MHMMIFLLLFLLISCNSQIHSMEIGCSYASYTTNMTIKNILTAGAITCIGAGCLWLGYRYFCKNNTKIDTAETQLPSTDSFPDMQFSQEDENIIQGRINKKIKERYEKGLGPDACAQSNHMWHVEQTPLPSIPLICSSELYDANLYVFAEKLLSTLQYRDKSLRDAIKQSTDNFSVFYEYIPTPPNKICITILHDIVSASNRLYISSITSDTFSSYTGKGIYVLKKTEIPHLAAVCNCILFAKDKD